MPLPTEEEIRRLIPGTCLDSYVEEVVIGGCPHMLGASVPGGFHGRQYFCIHCGAGPFDFASDSEGKIITSKNWSTNLTAAWELLDRLGRPVISRLGPPDTPWLCSSDDLGGRPGCDADGSTAAAAICKAVVLAAKMGILLPR